MDMTANGDVVLLKIVEVAKLQTQEDVFHFTCSMTSHPKDRSSMVFQGYLISKQRGLAFIIRVRSISAPKDQASCQAQFRSAKDQRKTPRTIGLDILHPRRCRNSLNLLKKYKCSAGMSSAGYGPKRCTVSKPPLAISGTRENETQKRLSLLIAVKTCENHKTTTTICYNTWSLKVSPSPNNTEGK